MGPNHPAFDLAIELPPRTSRQRGRDLHRQLRAAIVGGRLQPGVQLPATRELAAALGVSRNMVVAAYDRLLSEGYVSAGGRAGTRVADFLVVARRGRTGRPPAPRRDPRLSPAWRAPSPLIPIGERDGHRVDFGVGHPGLGLVSVRRLAPTFRPRATRRIPIARRLWRAGGTPGPARGNRRTRLVRSRDRMHARRHRGHRGRAAGVRSARAHPRDARQRRPSPSRIPGIRRCATCSRRPARRWRRSPSTAKESVSTGSRGTRR